MTRNSNIFYHLVAFLTVAIWGTTFVATMVATKVVPHIATVRKATR